MARQRSGWPVGGVKTLLIDDSMRPPAVGAGDEGRPLSRLKVVELGTAITGPLAACLLGELGAEVIKVERRDGGDPFRNFMGGSYSPQFRAYNKNKKSVALDLAVPANQEKLRDLLRDADVLIDNFRPGTLARLGLDDAILTAQNPRLIRCSITGFGTVGPYADRASYDTVAQALSGMAGLFIDPDRPRITGPTIADNVTGMYAALGILAALHERQRTGLGRRVSVNMLESAMAFMPDIFSFAESGIDVRPDTRASASQCYVMRCADTRMLVVHLSSPQKFWEGLVAAIERPDLLEDERFLTRNERCQHYAELNDILSEVFSSRARSEWMARLDRADVPFAPVNTIGETIADPQVRALGTFYEMASPDGGTMRLIGCPILFDDTRLKPQCAPPLLGEHNETYLTDKTTRKQ